jgi:hypothetical protein
MKKAKQTKKRATPPKARAKVLRAERFHVLAADSPIDVQDTSSFRRKKIVLAQYTLNNGLLVPTSLSPFFDGYIFSFGYQAASFNVVDPVFNYSLQSAAPWTLTLNNSVMLHSGENRLIAFYLVGKRPSSSQIGRINIPEQLTSLRLTVNETGPFGFGQVAYQYPPAQGPIIAPANGHLHAIICYCPGGRCTQCP